MSTYNDPELGTVSVCSADPVWPWYLCGFFTVALLGLMFMGGVWFASRAHNPPSLTPTIEEPKP